MKPVVAPTAATLLTHNTALRVGIVARERRKK
jgi:hypothetical protein